jgi:hypothetical protein
MEHVSKELIRIAKDLRVKRNEPLLADQLTRFAQQIGQEFDPSMETQATNPLLAEDGSGLAVKQFASQAPVEPEAAYHTLTVTLKAPPEVSRNEMMNYISDIENHIQNVKAVRLDWGVKEEEKKRTN